eukprot:2591960-Amphidinium_carterae.1
MKGGFPGASSGEAPSSDDGRLAWVQASRVLHGPGLRASLPWQKSSWLREVFSQGSSSPLPSFDRGLFTDVFPRESQALEPPLKVRKITGMPAARGRIQGDRAEEAGLRMKVVHEWRNWFMSHLEEDIKLRRDLENDSTAQAIKITEDVLRGKATGTLLLRL